MDSASWSEDYSQAIVEAAPPVPETTEPELARTWSAIRVSLPAAAGPGRRRRVRVAIGAALSAATLAVGGVAAAAVLSAQTGEYPADAEDVRLGGPGELLDPAASDFGEAIAELTADIPFPAGQARQSVRQNLVADGQRGLETLSRVSTSAIRAGVAQGAVCAWADSWAAATASGDTAARDDAVSRLNDASTWPAVTAVDPNQKSRTQQVTLKDALTGKVSTKTVDASTQFAYLKLVQKATRGTDLGAVDSALAKVYCYGVRTPNLPLTSAANK